MSDALRTALEYAQRNLPRTSYATILGELRRAQGVDRLRARGVERRLAELLPDDAELSAGERLLVEAARNRALAEYDLALSATGAPKETVVSAVVQHSQAGIHDLAISGGQYVGTVCDPRVFEAGDIVTYAVESQRILGHSLRFAADTVEDVARAVSLKDERPSLGFHGNPKASVLFVGERPSLAETARREAFVGEDGVFFRANYLGPLGLEKSQVAFGYVSPYADGSAAPVGWLNANLADHTGAQVVALGRAAADALGDRADETIPHPSSVRKSGRVDQVDRKLRRVSRSLAGRPITSEIVLAERNRGTLKQVVTGVILNPNALDSFDTWWPPELVERLAYGFAGRAGAIGNQHETITDGRLVESAVEFYPSPEERAKAFRAQTHTVHRRRFGRGFISSGCWWGSVQLNDDDWAQVMSGERTGFSVGAMARIGEAGSKLMPEINFVDIGPLGAA